MNAPQMPHLRDSFKAVAPLAAAYTLLKLAVPFAQNMIFGYTDADISRMTDQVLDTPFSFLGTSILMAAGHQLASIWPDTGVHRAKPAKSAGATGRDRGFRFNVHNY